MLYIIATPIGNLEDITFRAIRILKGVDLIISEDTRRTKKLLSHYEINNKLTSYHEHTSKKKHEGVINLLKEGKDIALVSDAGTPLISDPGYLLVKESKKNGIKIIPIPGPSSPIAALSVSGLTSDKFAFFGFMPRKDSTRRKILSKVKEIDITSIFFESPHRIKKTIKIIAEELPEHNVIIAREMTKKFEEIFGDKSTRLYEKIKENEIKGEIVLLIDKKLN